MNRLRSTYTHKLKGSLSLPKNTTGTLGTLRQVRSEERPLTERHIYVIGVRHDGNTDFQKKTTTEIIKIMKKHNGSEPLFFTEFGMDPGHFGLPHNMEFIKELEELAFIGRNVELVHHICAGIQAGWKHPKYLQNIVKIQQTFVATFNFQSILIDRFIHNFTSSLQKNKKIVLSEINQFAEKFKEHQIQVILELFNDPHIVQIVGPNISYIEKLFDNLNKPCNNVKLFDDVNISFLRDYSLLLEIQRYETAVDINAPFIMIVGKQHIVNLRKMLKYYKNVKFIRVLNDKL